MPGVFRVTNSMLRRVVAKKRAREALEIAAYRKKMKLAKFRRLAGGGGSTIVAPLALDIVNQFLGSTNSLGQRAWPEVSGYPPVFGNAIGEIAHTGGGSYIWTGFSWEPAILGG